MQPLFILAGSAVTVDSFAGKHALVLYEFQEFCGFLVVDRVQHLGTLCAHRPRAFRFGLKRDRRKLHIEPLHLPPEESRAQGSAGTDARLEQRSKDRAERLKEEEQSSAAASPSPSTTTSSSSSSAGNPSPAPVTAPRVKMSVATVAEAPAISPAATAPAGAAGASVSAATSVPRQYKRLNLGGNSSIFIGFCNSKCIKF